MSEETRQQIENTAPGPLPLRYGVCDCEYPCGCCEFEGKCYSSWQEVLKHLVKQRDEFSRRVEELETGLRRTIPRVHGPTHNCLFENCQIPPRDGAISCAELRALLKDGEREHG